jgi:hypothetical protein
VKDGKNPDVGSLGKDLAESSARVVADAAARAPKLNMVSVENLGYGDIDADVLAELIALGKVKTTEKNGVITFKNVGGKPTKQEVVLVRNRDYDGLKQLLWMK